MRKDNEPERIQAGDRAKTNTVAAEKEQPIGENTEDKRVQAST